MLFSQNPKSKKNAVNEESLQRDFTDNHDNDDEYKSDENTKFTRKNNDGSSQIVIIESKKSHKAQQALKEHISVCNLHRQNLAYLTFSPQELESQLARVTCDLADANDQKELLKLQMLESKRPNWIEQARSETGYYIYIYISF